MLRMYYPHITDIGSRAKKIFNIHLRESISLIRRDLLNKNIFDMPLLRGNDCYMDAF